MTFIALTWEEYLNQENLVELNFKLIVESVQPRDKRLKVQVTEIIVLAMDVQPELCAICKTPVDKSFPFSILYAKGSSAINQAMQYCQE